MVVVSWPCGLVLFFTSAKNHGHKFFLTKTFGIGGVLDS